MKKCSPDSNQTPGDTSNTSIQNVTPPYRTHLTKLNTIIEISEKLIESQTKSINDIVSNCSKICSGCEFHCMKILDICNQIVSNTLNSSYNIINMCQAFNMESNMSSSSPSDINNIPKRGRRPNPAKRKVKTSAPKSTVLINPGAVVNLGMNKGKMLSSSAGIVFDVLEQNETLDLTKIKVEQNVTELKIEQNVTKVIVDNNLTKIKVEKDDCPSSEDEIIDVVSEEPDRRQISSEVEDHSEDKTEDHDIRDGESESSPELSDSDGLEYDDNEDDDPDWDAVNQEVYENDSEFTCSVCTRSFKYEKAYKRHKLSHQIQNNTKDFVCGVCDERFDMKHKLKTHITSQTDKDHFKLHVAKNLVKVEKQCEICGKQYKDKRCLERHLIMHSGVKEFACKLCDYKGYSNEHLSKHMIRHTGIKKYICHHCGKGFPRKGELIKHLGSHSGIRAFHCDGCPKSFALKCHLDRHKKIHKAGDMPYVCDICGKRSRQSYNITVHMRTHTGHKPFSCEICGNKFAHNVSLRQHKKSCHGVIPKKVETRVEV